MFAQPADNSLVLFILFAIIISIPLVLDRFGMFRRLSTKPNATGDEPATEEVEDSGPQLRLTGSNYSRHTRHRTHRPVQRRRRLARA